MTREERSLRWSGVLGSDGFGERDDLQRGGVLGGIVVEVERGIGIKRGGGATEVRNEGRVGERQAKYEFPKIGEVCDFEVVLCMGRLGHLGGQLATDVELRQCLLSSHLAQSTRQSAYSSNHAVATCAAYCLSSPADHSYWFVPRMAYTCSAHTSCQTARPTRTTGDSHFSAPCLRAVLSLRCTKATLQRCPLPEQRSFSGIFKAPMRIYLQLDPSPPSLAASTYFPFKWRVYLTLRNA